jgi:catechol 2,3-dioxygenase-like lactoylglutathione lyase family enzyme
MTIKRMDHISVVVEDLETATAFFTTLGMALEGEAPIEGAWVDRVKHRRAGRGALMSFAQFSPRRYHPPVTHDAPITPLAHA